MALIVEDGTGLSTAEAFISVADADTYHAARGNPVAWSGASVSTKEACLRAGATYLGRIKWKGTRRLEAQALAWPRYSVVDGDGFSLSSTAVPERIRRANAELALRHVYSSILPDSAENGLIRTRSKVGPLETEKEWAGGKPGESSFPAVDALIVGLTLASDRVVFI